MTISKEKWDRWHPIARNIAQLMISRDQPDLTDEEIAAIEQDFAKLFDKTELRNAVRDVLFLAAALEHEGASQIARRLFALVESKPVIGALDRVNHLRALDRAELVAKGARRFADFSRNDRVAPAKSTAAPAREGSNPSKGLRVRDLGLIPVLV